MRFREYINEATTGLASWNKWFRGKGTVKTTTRSSAKVYDSNGVIIQDEYIEAGETIDVIDIKPEKVKNTLLSTVLYNGQRVLIPFNKIAKPISKGATEKLRINASKILQSSHSETVTLINKTFSAKVFHTKRDLAISIINGFNNAKLVPDYITQNIEEYLNQSSYKTISWDEDISNSQRNEIGKYFGEIIIGLLGLNKELTIRGVLKPGEVESFVVPDDPAFSGIDSLFIRKKDGSVVAISSKFGVGAKASFFSNLVPNMVRNKQMLKSSKLKAIVNIVEKNSLNPSRQGKNILYIYGFNYILGMRNIKNPMKIYDDIRKGNMTSEVKSVMNTINKKTWKLEGNEKQIKDALPNSLTSFFSRTLSYMLNNDRQAIDDMLTVLGAKDYWQANLSISDFKNGSIKYSFINSGSAKLKIIGSKAAIGDITASQGMINYQLS